MEADRARLWRRSVAALTAYREMDWFSSSVHDHHLERAWVAWDRVLLDDCTCAGSSRSAGLIIPGFLRVVLSAGVRSRALWWWQAILTRRRHSTDKLWMAYLAGTLGAYALFPYFPSDPPAHVFPASDLPHVITVLRQVNLYIVGGYGIHSSVFPSAHVSSAFSAAWGLLMTIPEKRWIGWSVAAYAVMVSVATVYGRYHYGVDVLAGFAVSLSQSPPRGLVRPMLYRAAAARRNGGNGGAGCVQMRRGPGP